MCCFTTDPEVMAWKFQHCEPNRTLSFASLLSQVFVIQNRSWWAQHHSILGVYNSLSNQSLMFQHSDVFQYLPSTDSDAKNKLGLYSLSAWSVSGGSLLLRNCQVNRERETQFDLVLSSTFQKHLWHFTLFSPTQECVHLSNFDRSSLASVVNLTSLGRGNLNWGITFIKLTCGRVYGAFSKLLIDVGEPSPLWEAPSLSR